MEKDVKAWCKSATEIEYQRYWNITLAAAWNSKIGNFTTYK